MGTFYRIAMHFLPREMSAYVHQKQLQEPWLVWLSGLSTSLRTKGSPVQFKVRAHAWVAAQVTSWIELQTT